MTTFLCGTRPWSSSSLILEWVPKVVCVSAVSLLSQGVALPSHRNFLWEKAKIASEKVSARIRMLIIVKNTVEGYGIILPQISSFRLLVPVLNYALS